MNTTEKEVEDALESLGYSNSGSTEAIPDIYRHPEEGMPKLCVRDLIYHNLTSREKIEGFIAERLVRPLSDAENLAGKLLAFIKINHQRGTFADCTDDQLEEHLKPFEEELRSLRANANVQSQAKRS